MFAYCLLKKDDILYVMSSKSINLNLGKYILYSKLPFCDKSTLIIQFNLTYNEKRDLVRLSKFEYILNKNIQLENAKYRILYQDISQKEYIKNMQLLYKEIKFGSYDEKKMYQNHLKFNKINTKKLRQDYEDILYKYEYIKNVRVDRIKGFLYGLVSEAELNEKVFLDENTSFYSEKLNIEEMIISLKNRKMLDRSLYNRFILLKNELNRKVTDKLNSIDKKQILFSFNYFRKIEFNNNFLKLSILEKEIYEMLINKIVVYKEDNYGKDILYKVILEITRFIESNNNFSKLLNDMLLLQKRIISNDYTVDVNEIESILIKNIYAVYIKFNNVKELYSYIDNKNIEKSFIAVSIYGACQGFSNMSYSTVMGVENNSYAFDVVKASIENIYDNYYNLRYSMYYTRDKINLCINNIALYRKKIKNFNIKDTKFSVEEKNSEYTITINNSNLGTMAIYIYNRKPKMASSIIYFDNRIKRLSSVYSNLENDKKIYFHYLFLNDSKYNISNLQKEYYFSIILKEVYDNIKGGL